MPITVIAASIGSPIATATCTAGGMPPRGRREMAYAGVIDAGRGRGRVHGGCAARAGLTAWARLQPGSEHLFEECGNVVVTPIEDRSDHLDPHPLEAAAGGGRPRAAGALGLRPAHRRRAAAPPG